MVGMRGVLSLYMCNTKINNTLTTLGEHVTLMREEGKRSLNFYACTVSNIDGDVVVAAIMFFTPLTARSCVRTTCLYQLYGKQPVKTSIICVGITLFYLV